MAKEQKQGSGIRLKLIRKLTIAEEARNEPQKGAYPGGRIKRFFDIFKANYSNMTILNGLSMLFLLPMLAVILYFMLKGMEDFAYMLENMEKPYLLANFGIGLSNGVSPLDVRLAMLVGYRIMFLGVFLTLPIFSFGIAGMLYVLTKFVWGEGFITKKDKYGNNIPRIVVEYFRGIKKYWLQTLICVSILSVILLGGVNMIITFIEAQVKGSLNAGHYIGLILSCIVMLFALLTFINLLPTVVSYKTRFIDKLKNSSIFTVTLFVPNLFILIFFLAPFALLMLGNIAVIIVTIALIMFGFSFFTLMFVNYADNNSEKILVPIYEMQQKEQAGIKKSKKKKKGNK